MRREPNELRYHLNRITCLKAKELYRKGYNLQMIASKLHIEGHKVLKQGLETCLSCGKPTIKGAIYCYDCSLWRLLE